MLGVGAVAGCTSGTSTPEAAGSIPDPTGFVVTRWRQDPLARGAYSFLAVGAEPEDRTRLAEPVGERLFFAGEATHRTYPATVHGALMSGRRAAGAVLATGARSAIVVGAGAAGLATAARLHERGVTVQVVEGRDRLGGRVWTDASLGAPVDLGASWIHGVAGNPLTDLADMAGIARVPTDYDDVVVRESGGTVLGELPAEMATVVEIEQEYAADVADLAPGATEEGGAAIGGDVLFPGGYAAVLPALRTGYEVVLDAVVTSIEHGETGVVVAGDAQVWNADAAIVTVPLGVLQAGAIEFVPPLPPAKQAAIDRLGMGLLDKVALRFDRVFWDADAEFLLFAGPDRGRFWTWLNMVPVNGAPVLVAFNAGSAAEQVAQLDDDAVVIEAMAALRAMYGSG